MNKKLLETIAQTYLARHLFKEPEQEAPKIKDLDVPSKPKEYWQTVKDVRGTFGSGKGPAYEVTPQDKEKAKIPKLPASPTLPGAGGDVAWLDPTKYSPSAITHALGKKSRQTAVAQMARDIRSAPTKLPHHAVPVTKFLHQIGVVQHAPESEIPSSQADITAGRLNLVLTRGAKIAKLGQKFKTSQSPEAGQDLETAARYAASEAGAWRRLGAAALSRSRRIPKS